MGKVWFVTGGGSGLGYAIVRSALDAGDEVVLADRDISGVDRSQLDSDRSLVLSCDVSDSMKTQSSVEQAIERFGRIDVLVNNAGFGHGGMFEEIAQEDIDRMFGTNVFGVFNVTRSVLPFMRASRYGRIVNISSIAAVRGVPGGSQYCACKYAVEGFSEALATEVEQFGVKVTIVQPGLFRTNFFKAEAIRYATHSISDYDALLKEVLEKYDAVNGVQPGDPAKLAKLIVDLAHHADPPLRIAAGSDAVEVVEQKLNLLRSEFERWRDLSSSTDFS